MKKIILAIVVLIGIIIIALMLEPKNTSNPQNSPAAKPATSGVAKTYTLEEVAKHASANDCWLVIHGKVYDVTKFIPSHPGGTAILQGCGKDATQLFETRPMGSGTPHSSRAREMMKDYEIGDLTQ